MNSPSFTQELGGHRLCSHRTAWASIPCMRPTGSPLSIAQGDRVHVTQEHCRAPVPQSYGARKMPLGESRGLTWDCSPPKQRLSARCLELATQGSRCWWLYQWAGLLRQQPASEKHVGWSPPGMRHDISWVFNGNKGPKLPSETSPSYPFSLQRYVVSFYRYTVPPKSQGG